MNALCGLAVRLPILALAVWPLVGVLDHDRVVSERQAARLCDGDPASRVVVAWRRAGKQPTGPAAR